MTGMSTVVDETFQKPLYGLSLRLSLSFSTRAQAQTQTQTHWKRRPSGLKGSYARDQRFLSRPMKAMAATSATGSWLLDRRGQ